MGSGTATAQTLPAPQILKSSVQKKTKSSYVLEVLLSRHPLFPKPLKSKAHVTGDIGSAERGEGDLSKR